MTNLYYKDQYGRFVEIDEAAIAGSSFEEPDGTQYEITKVREATKKPAPIKGIVFREYDIEYKIEDSDYWEFALDSHESYGNGFIHILRRKWINSDKKETIKAWKKKLRKK